MTRTSHRAREASGGYQIKDLGKIQPLKERGGWKNLERPRRKARKKKQGLQRGSCTPKLTAKNKKLLAGEAGVTYLRGKELGGTK